MPTLMRIRNAQFTGSLVAECPTCNIVCVYWDEEDLDDDGNLLCWCDTHPSPYQQDNDN